MNVNELIAAINDGTYDENLKAVYVTDKAVEEQKPRYVETLNDFGELFGYDREVNIMSAPGRTEVCGNHTDHNNGKVLAASINLDAIAVVSKNDDNIIRVKSKGHKMNVVDLDDLVPNEANFGSSTTLVQGVAATIKNLGYTVAGFDACTTSDVMGGSGLSSSAAFEVLLGSILSYMFNDGKISPVEIAKVAQYSENVFFGKPCGLLDQMASSVGTFVTIDFKSTKDPVIKKIDFDFSKSGHSLCIVDTHGNHSDLTDDYAAVRAEMESVAQALGKNVLREVSYEEFFAALPELTGRVNDRAILRAIHFFNENKRVEKAVECLENNDFEGFKQVIIDSGRSSFMLNQNVYTPKNPTEQKLSLALAISKELLDGKGAWRVHGGGFAGTIQAFVPNDMLDEYKKTIEGVFGEGSCHVLIIRPVGGTQVI
ncbi:MAG: galactokinase [Eubacterium coprostanoligenes]|uniref:galactokinase n=2 Tax=Eubacterium coprostanoligenes TaxID=290054 RepID=UPI00235466B7|nr:galactokinase family protein [Eubacterium coprostanoligenes]MCI6361614.1 galactokinase [Eubacterium coprostanoligenes]MCI7265462.1 galactokinase [Eubacterium coprostanoligenes]MDD6666225.1 galactokinase family protein [Eubacterium coprostanoligenes]